MANNTNPEVAKENRFFDFLPKMLRPPVRRIEQKPPIIGYYEFTQEEIRTLQECDRESFYGRCLPLSTLFATLTYIAVKNGI